MRDTFQCISVHGQDFKLILILCLIETEIAGIEGDDTIQMLLLSHVSLVIHVQRMLLLNIARLHYYLYQHGVTQGLHHYYIW